MRKRGFLVMTMLVVMAMLFASCTSHLGEDENAAASKAVKINFAVIVDEEAAQKEVALHGGVNDFKFFYKATPQWKSASAIQGDTQGAYVEINSDMATMTTDNVSIGYFKPGLWKFDVVITSADGTPATALDGSKVIYKAETDWSNEVRSLFDSSDRTVNLPAATMELNEDAGGAKATVKIKLAVPKILTGTAPDVTVAFNGGSTFVAESTVDASPDADTKIEVTAEYDSLPVSNANTTNWYYFERTITNVIPGNYNITLKYKDAASGNQVGGAFIATTILPTDYTIWGTIENGEFQIATVTLDVATVTIDFATKVGGAAATSVVAGGTMVCTPDPLKSSGAIDTMAWYVNGVAQAAGVDGTSGEFTFGTSSTTTTANPGTYEIVCKAQKGTAVYYKSRTVTVTPAP